MKQLFRSPMDRASRLAPAARPALGALLLMTAFGVSAQQWTRGATVWNNIQCGQCHNSGNLSLASMQSRYLTVTAARNASDAGASRSGAMAVFWNSLNESQKNDVAAYVADYRAEGNVSAIPGAALSVAAVGNSTDTVVTLFNNGRAPMTVVANNGVRIAGTGAAQFALTGIGNGCLAQTLAANGGSCQVRVTYQPSVAPSPNHTATLTFEHNGEPQTTTTLALSGSIAAAPAPAPTPTPAPASDGGGGALPLALWATLLPAALVARRRRD